jgi:DNA invertase Pin-like site-specific DNA recombinase
LDKAKTTKMEESIVKNNIQILQKSNTLIRQMGTLTIKAKTRNEVANEYDINVRTLYRWLNNAHIILPRGLIKPCHLQIIYNEFGIPQNLEIE